MSRNSAWSAYNEKMTSINATYDAIMKPLRENLTTAIESIQKKFDANIKPLLKERDTQLEIYNAEFKGLVAGAVKERDNAVQRARKVLDAELEEQRQARSTGAESPRKIAEQVPMFSPSKGRTVTGR